jgi:hypothetical protein
MMSMNRERDGEFPFRSWMARELMDGISPFQRANSQHAWNWEENWTLRVESC